MTISSVFIRRPRLAFVISTVISIAGVIALTALPVAQFPDIVPPQVQVTADLSRRLGAGGRGERRAGHRGPGQRRRAHDLHEVDLGRRRQLQPDRQLRGRLRPRPQHRERHQPGQPGARPAAARGAAQRRHRPRSSRPRCCRCIAVYSPKGTRDALFLSNFATINMLDTLKRVPGVGDAEPVRPARLLDAHLAQPRPHGEPRHHAQRRRQGGPVAERAGRGRPGRRRAADGRRRASSSTSRTQGRLTTIEEFENIVVRATPDGALVRHQGHRPRRARRQDQRFGGALQRQAGRRHRDLPAARRQCAGDRRGGARS